MLNNLIKKIQKQYWQYLILFIGLIIFGWLFFLMAGFPFGEIVVIIGLGLFYFAWGNWHHLVNKDWHVKIALEYLLIAIIGCGLLLSIILRG
jgi:hypothetical protein